MSWFLLNRNLTPLEPYDWKLSRTVLRGERGSNAPDLPGKAIAKEGMAEYIRYVFKTVRKFYGVPPSRNTVTGGDLRLLFHSPHIQ